MFHQEHFIGYEERVKSTRVHARIVLVLSIILVMLSTVSVFADSLSDLTSDSKASTGSSQTGELLQGLNDSVDFSNSEDETVAKVKEPLKRVFGIIVQIGSYILTFGIVAVTVVDMIYILIPPFQGLLSCGKTGNPIQGGQQGGAQPGMGGMSMGGMNGGMMGGMNRMGGMPMGGMMGGMNQQQAQPQQQAGMCFVSQEAMNAVASTGMPDPTTGKPMSALKVYFKEATVKMVLAPTLLVLAVTGILGKLGFAIGGLIGGAIQAGISMMS
jgi:hypothetical protein